MDKELKTILDRHDLIFEKPARQWEQGAFMGNGMLGTVVWGGMDRPVKISLDRADIWDVRNVTPDFEGGYNWKTFSECMEEQDEKRFFGTFMGGMRDHPRPSRFHIGRVELIPKGKMQSHTMRLRLADAVTEGKTITDLGTIEWKTWVAATENLIVVDMKTTGSESFTPNLKYIARDDYTEQDIKDSTRYAAHGDIFGHMSDRMKKWGYKSSEEGCTEDGITFWKQEIPENGSIATAYRTIRLAEDHEVLIYTINCDRKSADCSEEAIRLVRVQDAESLLKLFETHCSWWDAYYSRSFISIPDMKLEALYYIEVYKLACSTHPGGLHMTLCGPWTDDDGLPAYCANDYHWNLEQEMQLWSIYTGNRLDFGMPMYDMIDAARPTLHDFCQKFFRHEGEFLAHCTDIDCKGLGGIDNFEFNGLPWVSFMYWQHYRYSMDKEFLKTRCYPLMREAARMMILELKEWDDGYLHLPWTSSPEYHGPDETYRWVTHGELDWMHRFGPDATIDLSLLRFMCRTLLETVNILGEEDPDQESWEHTLAHLVPYEFDRFGCFTVRKDLPITTTHRHQSHLFPIYPLHELDADKPEDKKIMENCLTVLGINGRGEWVGWSFPWVSLLGAYSGRPAMARNVLLDYADRYVTESGTHYQGPQGSCDVSLYFTPSGNFGNTIEAGFGYIAAIQELAIQSNGGVIRLFENTPPAWANLSISSMRTEGAFLVTAEREMYQTKFAKIIAEQGGTLKLRSAFGDGKLHALVNGKEENAILEDGMLTLETIPGDEIVIYAGENVPDQKVHALLGNVQEYHYYGVKNIARF